MKAQVKELRGKVKNSPDDLKSQLKTFLHEADEEVASLDKSLSDVQKMNKQIAEYFCEDTKKFKMEECLVEVNMFLSEFEAAVKV